MLKATRMTAASLVALSIACVSAASAVDDAMFSTRSARGDEGLRTVKVTKGVDRDRGVSYNEFIRIHEATFAAGLPFSDGLRLMSAMSCTLLDV